MCHLGKVPFSLRETLHFYLLEVQMSILFHILINKIDGKIYFFINIITYKVEICSEESSNEKYHLGTEFFSLREVEFKSNLRNTSIYLPRFLN